MKKVLLTSLCISASSVIALTACTSDKASSDSLKGNASPTKHIAAPAAVIQNINTANISSDLDKFPIEVKVTNGKITNAKIVGKDTENYKINKSSENDWKVNGTINPADKYVLNVDAINADGAKVSKSFNITTKAPINSIYPTVFPYGNQTVGVGMPITVDFQEPVKDRAYVEKHLSVETSPKVNGSWGWTSESTVVWKPDTFWKPGTNVTAKINTRGLNMGNGIDRSNLVGKFKIGRSFFLKVDNNTKMMTVEENGKKVKSFPVSLGKPGHRTSSGTSIIYEKQSPVRMKGEDYDEMVYYAQRYTTMGEYVHSAPWSVWAQGSTNVSHGCVNVAPENAIWLWKKTLLGDVVQIKNTGSQVSTWNGMGGIWNYSAKEWKAQSAIK